MRVSLHVIGVGLVVAGLNVASGTPAARAQMSMSGSGRSLGGYGASTIASYYGGVSPAYLPYNGNAHGFLAYRGGSGSGLGSGVAPIPRRLPQTSIGGAMMSATPIGGASLGGAGGMSGGRGRARGLGLPFGYEGGISGGGMAPMSRGMSPPRPSLGPGFGSPFRVPMSLGSGTSPMSMP
jgi:hypothetical protein